MKAFPLLSRRGAFTIVELLAATAVFIGLMLMLVTATNMTGDVWRRSATKVEQFQQARRGFESMTRKISQATLNTYWDYSYPIVKGKPDKTAVPKGYVRQSELRFRSAPMSTFNIADAIGRPSHGIFFQAPLGFVEDRGEPGKANHEPLDNLLNTWGYFLEVNDDKALIPNFLNGIIQPRLRSRLMELMEPSEVASIDNPAETVLNAAAVPPTTALVDKNWDKPWNGWFVDPIKKHTNVRSLAENVMALVILPRLTSQDESARKVATPPKTETLCPIFDYDSKRTSNAAAALGNPTLAPTDAELNPKNQLPPTVTVAMVAIDEVSAQRLAALAPGDTTLGLDLTKLFKNSALLEDDPGSSEAGDGDLAKLENMLRDRKLTYRTFISNVTIRGAKWSRNQTN